MSSVTVHLPGVLQPLAGGAPTIDVPIDGTATFADVVSHLERAHPGVHARIVDEHGSLRRHVNVFVGDDSVRLTGILHTPVSAGDDVWVIPAVSA